MAYANPLPLVVSQLSLPPERRRGLRCQQGWHVRLLAGDEPGGLAAEVVDVSDAGCFLVTGVAPPVQVGERCAFGWSLPDGRRALAKGRVLRVGSRGFALKLEEVNTAFGETLRAVCRASDRGPARAVGVGF